MGETIHLRVCEACHTAVPVEATACPVCGARGADGPEVGIGREVMGLLARTFLRRHVGCLLTVLLVLFGSMLLFAALLADPVGVLGFLLAAVGLAGLASTAILVWLLLPLRRR